MAVKRYYIVGWKDDSGNERIVNASTKAQARSHVAGDEITVRVATTPEVARLVKKGVEIEEVGEEAA